jgi:hypothetical protein
VTRVFDAADREAEQDIARIIADNSAAVAKR